MIFDIFKWIFIKECLIGKTVNLTHSTGFGPDPHELRPKKPTR